METTMAKAIEVRRASTSDYTSEIHLAERADGVWFERQQTRHPLYGYRWGAWRQRAVAPADDEGCRVDRTVRLPN
jgi:hypothetical protein